eukprot:175059-Alexandrium_andersonii.AAC.1
MAEDAADVTSAVPSADRRLRGGQPGFQKRARRWPPRLLQQSRASARGSEEGAVSPECQRLQPS